MFDHGFILNEPQFFKLFGHFGSCFLHDHSFKFSRRLGHPVVFIDRYYFLEVQFPEKIHVCLVPIAADHQHPRAKIRLCRRVFQDWNFMVITRHDRCQPLILFIPGIIRVENYGLTCAHQFWSGCCDSNKFSLRFFDWKFD